VKFRNNFKGVFVTILAIAKLIYHWLQMSEGIWSTDGIIGKENQSIHRKSCPIATLSTINPTLTGLKPTQASVVRSQQLTT